jgi:hypothetical protein
LAVWRLDMGYHPNAFSSPIPAGRAEKKAKPSLAGAEEQQQPSICLCDSAQWAQRYPYIKVRFRIATSFSYTLRKLLYRCPRRVRKRDPRAR